VHVCYQCKQHVHVQNLQFVISAEKRLFSVKNVLVARDALGCASSISYATFVLSQLSVSILNWMDAR